MEGLTFGWKKSIEFFHYYPSNEATSLCQTAHYNLSRFKNHEFLSEKELEEELLLCRKCIRLRQSDMKKLIIAAKSESEGFWDDSSVCPKCKTPVIFYNSQKNNDHFCTICKNMVVLA